MNRSRAHAIGASIEISARQAVEDSDLKGLFPPGTRVYIPDLGTEPAAQTVAGAKRLADLGYIAVPHIAVRRFKTLEILRAYIADLTNLAGVRDVLLLGGNSDRSTGDVKCVMEVLWSGLLDKYGIEHIGIAGHPEGSPDFSDEVAAKALDEKWEFSQHSDAAFRIVTQFGFDGARFVEWARQIRSHDIDLPIHVGVAGPAKLTTLIKFGLACGVGNSLSFLRKRGSSVTGLVSHLSPEEVVEPIECEWRSPTGTRIEQIHIFAFGGIKAATAWLVKRGSW